jgi:hypothetical protein
MLGEVNSEGVRVDVGEATKGSVSHMKKFEGPKGPELVSERLLWMLCVSIRVPSLPDSSFLRVCLLSSSPIATS